jgi:hypothetical protein
MPAFWWLYNMYALERNAWKFQTRDRRKTRTQKIEYDYLAPDTAEEIFHALRLLEAWTAQAQLRQSGEPAESKTAEQLAALGRQLLLGAEEKTAALEILGENMENSRRKVVILKTRQAYHAYRQMLHYYAVKNLLHYMTANPQATLAAMCESLAGPREQNWVNLGGQLVPAVDVEQLLGSIKSGKLRSWPEIHAAYDSLWKIYPLQKQRHAYATLLQLLAAEELTSELWTLALDEAVRIQQYICDQVYLTRAKDYENPFRRITFRNAEEMRAVLGTPEENSFVKLLRKEALAFKKLVKAIRQRG